MADTKISGMPAAVAALATHKIPVINPALSDALKNQTVTGAQLAPMLETIPPTLPTGIKSYLFADLPLVPGLAIITDSNATAAGATVAGGGTNYVLAFGNGIRWVVVASNTTYVPPPLPTPDVVTAGTATGGIWPGTGTITDSVGAVWSIGLDRIVLKNGVAQALPNVMQLWYADTSVFAFYGDSWAVISGTSVAARPKMPTTPGLRMAVGPKTLTLPAGITINPGDNIQTVVDAHAAGTTYCLTKGTYSRQQVVQPKSGDRFFGEHDGVNGVIMDAEGASAFAFYIALGVDHVVVRNFTIVNYAAPVQSCAIQAIGEHALIQDCDVSGGTQGGGILMSGHGLMVGCRSHDNFQIGHKVVGDDVTGVVTVVGCLIDSNEFDHNNVADSILGGAEQGGGKAWDTQGLTYWYNYSHDNGGSGLWTDFDNINTRYWYNRIENNTNDGIECEIGFNCSIVGNHIEGNGSVQSASYFMSACAIGIENSGGITTGPWKGWIEIADNTCISGPHGRLIGLRDQDRGTSGLMAYTPDAWQVRNVYVHNNIIDGTEGLADTTMGMVRDHHYSQSAPGYISAPDFFGLRNIVFDYNAYTMSASTSYWAWLDAGFLNFTQWQSYGQDVHSTYSLAPDIDITSTPQWSIKNKEPDIVISNGGLTATGLPAVEKNMTGRGSTSKTMISVGQKRYFELTIVDASFMAVGLDNLNDTFNLNYLGATANSLGIYANGAVFTGGQATGATLLSFVATDIVMMAVDAGNKMWIGVNGVWSGDPAAGTGGVAISSLGAVFPAYTMRTNGSLTANFGATSFAYTAPTGFTAIPP